MLDGMKKTLAFFALLSILVPAASAAQPYDARRNGDVVQLEDRGRQMVVSILTSVGNVAYQMTVKGQDILRFPFTSVDEFRSRPGALYGIFLLAPWPNCRW